MALDAFTVCLAVGSAGQSRGPGPAFRLSFHFGLFQFLMPVIGWLAGTEVESLIRNYDHWVAFGLLALVGLRMIRAAFRQDDHIAGDPSRGWTLVLLSIAVSIDALAVGLSLGVLSVSVWYPAILIGLVTGGLSLAGLWIGRGLGGKLGPPFEVVGGVLLIGIGLRILLSHVMAV